MITDVTSYQSGICLACCYLVAIRFPGNLSDFAPCWLIVYPGVNIEKKMWRTHEESRWENDLQMVGFPYPFCLQEGTMNRFKATQV